MKSPLKSKTLIFNALLLAVGLFVKSIDESTRSLLVSTALINMGFRLGTREAIKIKKDK